MAASSKVSLVLIAIYMIVGALLLAGCEGERAQSESEPASRQTLASDRGFHVEVMLGSNAVTTAERLTLTIDTSVLDELTVQHVNVAAALPENWRIVEDRSEPGIEKSDEWRRERRIVVVEPFLDGAHEIRELEFSAKPREGGEVITLQSTSFAVTVHSVLAPEEQAEFADVKTVVEPPAPARVRMWGGIAAGAIVFVALTWWVVARMRAPKVIEPVRRFAHEVALERLDMLLASGLLQCARYKEFYGKASWILRRYIEDRFGLHAPKQTTEEFLAESRISLTLSSEDVTTLERFLRACDEVKFAAAEASQAQAEAVAAAVREFIERTRNDTSIVIVDESTPQTRGVAA